MDNQKEIEDAFLKQLQTGDQLNSFLAQLQKRGIHAAAGKPPPL